MTQWPVKIMLVHPKADFLKDDEITIAADCAVLVNREISDRFGKKAVLIGCPMLEDPKRVYEKIQMLMKEGEFSSVQVFTMEVPCCQALHMMVEREKGDKEIRRFIVRVNGNVEEYKGKIDESMIEAEKKAHRGF
ncbi:hypothetical protein [Geoglobus acetivorans]|uniref:Ferredoxin n=1 Tax=Geoglobus acetivorans TaxID=565033 RepID=A0ABZ3H592_GEOAI|nr:hypothetical protein [Geoglobus acetivorans]